MDIEGFKAELECTPNRVNNIPVPMGSVYTGKDCGQPLAVTFMVSEFMTILESVNVNGLLPK
jgi:hypothetical protein